MIRGAALALVLAATAACPAPQRVQAPHPPAGAPPAMRGITLALFFDQGHGAGWRDYAPELDDLRAAGANWVSLPVFWRQHDVTSMDLAPSEAVTIPDDDLRALIRAARARGLRVFLFPIIDLEVIGPGAWRGTLAPPDAFAWWARYEEFILHYAAIAGEEGVSLYSVGSELGFAEAWRDRWTHLLSAVEKVYHGDTIYSANWDRFEAVTWWERVTYVGVNGYFELTRDDDAGEDALAAAWDAPRRRLLAAAARIGHGLVITEVGYPSRDGGAAHPWDYTTGRDVDTEEQRRAYAAFARAWGGERGLAGVFFWNWQRPGGPGDGGYTPRGKPAETALRAWFRGDHL